MLIIFILQNFASGGVIVTGIEGNDSTVTFSGIEGTGKPQWVSFHYQSELSIPPIENLSKLTMEKTPTTWVSETSVSHNPAYILLDETANNDS